MKTLCEKSGGFEMIQGQETLGEERLFRYRTPGRSIVRVWNRCVYEVAGTVFDGRVER